MNDDKWFALTEQIRKRFVVSDEGKDERPDVSGEAEYLCFNGPLGLMKIERISSPRVIDKKIHASRRIGAAATVEYIYHPSEVVRRIKIYRWQNEVNGWQEIKAENLINNL